MRTLAGREPLRLGVGRAERSLHKSARAFGVGVVALWQKGSMPKQADVVDALPLGSSARRQPDALRHALPDGLLGSKGWELAGRKGATLSHPIARRLFRFRLRASRTRARCAGG